MSSSTSVVNITKVFNETNITKVFNEVVLYTPNITSWKVLYVLTEFHGRPLKQSLCDQFEKLFCTHWTDFIMRYQTQKRQIFRKITYVYQQVYLKVYHGCYSNFKRTNILYIFFVLVFGLKQKYTESCFYLPVAWVQHHIS